jgi:ComF family protein
MNTILANLGLCKDCAESIRLTKDMTFEGKEFIDVVIAPFLYGGVISESVRAFKFSSQKSYGVFLTALALEYLENKSILADCDMIIPVPLHKNRLRERGYNQSDIIADRLSKMLNIEVNKDTLFRIRDTLHQSSLKGYRRIENVKDAFITAGDAVCGKKILLADDIYTMGETANECARMLKGAGAKSVVVFALCKATEKSSSS